MGIRFKVDGKLVNEQVITTSEGINVGVNPPTEQIEIKPLEIQVADNIEDWKADNPESMIDTGYPFPKMTKGTPMSEEMTERLWSVINENTGLQQQVTLLKYKLESIKRILAE